MKDYAWDPAKAVVNWEKHGVDFASAVDFEWDKALGWIDDRNAYGEIREIAVAPIHGRLHVMVFTQRGQHIRIISLRKANPREVVIHAQALD